MIGTVSTPSPDQQAAARRLQKLGRVDSGTAVMAAGQGFYDVAQLGAAQFSPFVNGAFGFLSGAQALVGASNLHDGITVGDTRAKVLGSLRLASGLTNLAVICGLGGHPAAIAGLGLTAAALGFGLIVKPTAHS